MMPMGKEKGIQPRAPWILTDHILSQVPAALVAIATVEPFSQEGALGYLNHTLDLILDRIGEGIKGEKGERVLISTSNRWEAPWILLYGLGPKEDLSREVILEELRRLDQELQAIDMKPVAFLLPGYDPYRWGDAVESAQLLLEGISRPGLIVNPNREVLHRIHYRVKGYFNYLLKEESG